MRWVSEDMQYTHNKKLERKGSAANVDEGFEELGYTQCPALRYMRTRQVQKEEI